ncbi:hypothetical protein ACVWXN_003484 [Bradyrhizobium sp. i1.4.4]
MKIVKAFPPNFGAINAAFNVRGKPVIFCYGDRIYNPAGVVVGADLVAHESVHSKRQEAYTGGVTAWWDRYIADAEFRLAEEIPAHQAEFAYWCQRKDADQPVRGFRSFRDLHLSQIAHRLSGALYGGLIGLSEARHLLQGAQHGN